jgi:hypothetical protein
MMRRSSVGIRHEQQLAAAAAGEGVGVEGVVQLLMEVVVSSSRVRRN